jgi:hypothetical protein
MELLRRIDNLNFATQTALKHDLREGEEFYFDPKSEQNFARAKRDSLAGSIAQLRERSLIN